MNKRCMGRRGCRGVRARLGVDLNELKGSLKSVEKLNEANKWLRKGKNKLKEVNEKDKIALF